MMLIFKILTSIPFLFSAVITGTARQTTLGKYEYFSPANTAAISTIVNNKKYPGSQGAGISFLANEASYGIAVTSPGQEIFKDGNTVLLEQLVIPWLLHYTNRYRNEHGLDTLLYDQCLLKSAGYQTDYLFNESKKAHRFKLGHNQDPGSPWFKGKGPQERALSAGCVKYCGENALYTHLRPIPADDFSNRKKLNLAAQKIARDMVYTQWHQSKGHRENMLTKGYTNMGASVAIGKQETAINSTVGNGEKEIIKDNNTVGWIAFGIQVMAY